METVSYTNLRVTVEDRIAIVEVNRPEVLNALNAGTLHELELVFLSLRDAGEVGAVIITGVGDKAFVAGADIKELVDLDAVSGREKSLRGQAVFELIDSFPKPVIAAVNGYCLGGGCELAMACHMRIAAENAKFGQPELKLGLIPGYGGTQRLPRLVGTGKALEIILTGELVDASEAARIGLVNRVVPPSELTGHCRDLARKVLSNSPAAVSLALSAVAAGGDLPLPQALSVEASLFGAACGTADKREGTRAFLEKRKPVFKGR